MPNRVDAVGGEWAEGAPNLIGPPVPGATYANTLLTEITINQAWPFSNIVASNNFNEIMRRMTRLMIQLERQGILSYSILTNYGIGALVIGSDDILYKALVINGPDTALEDPVGNPTKWKDSGAGGVTNISTTGLAFGGPITEIGTIDVPIASKLEAETGVNDTTAMTPLRTRQAIPTSPPPTTTIRGVVEKSTSLENETGIAVDVYPDVVGVKEMIDEHGNPGTVTSILTTGLATGGEITDTGTIDVPKSTQSQAEAGTNDTTAMTPLQTKNAIDTLVADTLWTEVGADVYRPTGNVGIGGIPSSGAKFDVSGQIKITGGSPGADKVLTSNAVGLATWETPATGGGGSWELIDSVGVVGGEMAINGIAAGNYNTIAVSFDAHSQPIGSSPTGEIKLQIGDIAGLKTSSNYVYSSTVGGAMLTSSNFLLTAMSTTPSAGSSVGGMLYLTKSASSSIGPKIKGEFFYFREALLTASTGKAVYGVYDTALDLDQININFGIFDLTSGFMTAWGLKNT